MSIDATLTYTRTPNHNPSWEDRSIFTSLRATNAAKAAASRSTYVTRQTTGAPPRLGVTSLRSRVISSD